MLNKNIKKVKRDFIFGRYDEALAALQNSNIKKIIMYIRYRVSKDVFTVNMTLRIDLYASGDGIGSSYLADCEQLLEGAKCVLAYVANGYTTSFKRLVKKL